MIPHDVLVEWIDSMDTADLLDWAACFPKHSKNRKVTTMYYKYTVTFATTANIDEITDIVRWYLGAIDFGVVKVEAHIDPLARITNDRLKAYHARTRAAGFTTTEARHALIALALGRDIDGKASALTNAQFDKVMAKLDEIGA